ERDPPPATRAVSGRRSRNTSSPAPPSRTSITVAASRTSTRSTTISRLLAATLPPMAAVPPRWRERLLPKSVLGMAMLLVVASVGSAFSGAVLYAYYDYRLNQNERRVSHYIPDIQQRFKRATSAIDKAPDDGQEEHA